MDIRSKAEYARKSSYFDDNYFIIFKHLHYIKLINIGDKKINFELLLTSQKQPMNLKKTLLTLIFLSFVNFSSISQQLHWIKAGGHYARVAGLQTSTFVPQVGFHLGGGMEKIFSNPVGIKLEAVFNQKGFLSEEIKEYESNTRLWLNETEQYSLLLPVSGTLHFNRMYFELGFSLDFLLKSNQYEKETITFFATNNTIINEYHNRHKLSNPELAYHVGLGIKLFNGLNLTARFSQALTPIGIDYNWKRINYAQVGLAMRIGESFEPTPLTAFSTQTNNTRVAPFRVLSLQNITRVQFNRDGEGNQIRFRWQSVDSGLLQISNINLEVSNGFINSGGNRVFVSDVSFPMTGRLRYTTTNPITSQQSESYVEFEITNPGVWTISILNN